MTESRLPVAPRVVVALAVIALGVWWTAANLGWAESVDIGLYWPVVFIVIGLAKLSSSATGAGRSLGGLFTIVGVWIMADRLYNIPFHIDDWWPVLLIGWGVLLLFGGGRSPRAAAVGVGMPGRAEGPAFGGPAAAQGGAPSDTRATAASGDDVVSAFAIWSGTRRRIASTAFRRADLTAVMGGVTLDLRQASTATGEAVVEVFVMWGGINIRVPPDWIVSNEVVAIMGGTDDRSTGTPASRHRLVVRGFVMMGGVEIKT